MGVPVQVLQEWGQQIEVIGRIILLRLLATLTRNKLVVSSLLRFPHGPLCTQGAYHVTTVHVFT